MLSSVEDTGRGLPGGGCGGGGGGGWWLRGVEAEEEEEEEGDAKWWWVRLRRNVTWSRCCGSWIFSLSLSFSSLATILILASQLRADLTAVGWALGAGRLSL